METQSRNGSQQSNRASAGAPTANRQQESSEQQTGGDGGAQAGRKATGQSSQRGLSPRRSSSSALARRSADPLTSVLQLSREVDRLFDTVLDRSFDSLFDTSDLKTLWSPKIDVRERGDSLVVRADLPGIKSDNVRIEATPEGLAISGECEEEREEGDERGYRLTERRRGSFYRLIPLPEEAQVDNAKARMRDGVLEVTIPLEQGKGRRLIDIES